MDYVKDVLKIHILYGEIVLSERVEYLKMEERITKHCPVCDDEDFETAWEGDTLTEEQKNLYFCHTCNKEFIQEDIKKRKWINVNDLIKLLNELKEQNLNGNELDRQRALAFGDIITIINNSSKKGQINTGEKNE